MQNQEATGKQSTFCLRVGTKRPASFIIMLDCEIFVLLIIKGMGLQVIHDSSGKNTGVFIPYEEWEELKRHNKGLASLELEESKEDILLNIKKGLKEVALFKKGKLKTTKAKDFLNEL